jgi:hypothetical protein
VGTRENGYKSVSKKMSDPHIITKKNKKQGFSAVFTENLHKTFKMHLNLKV